MVTTRTQTHTHTKIKYYPLTTSQRERILHLHHYLHLGAVKITKRFREEGEHVSVPTIQRCITTQQLEPKQKGGNHVKYQTPFKIEREICDMVNANNTSLEVCT